MKAKPIIFSAPMVRALLEGRKTQTRRLLKPAPPAGVIVARCPFGNTIGAYLWVRETFGYVSPDEKIRHISECKVEYRADLPHDCDDMPGNWPRDEAMGDGDAPRWRPSIYMPRWASRLTLRITDIRVEKLKDIKEEDAIAEGLASDGDEAAKISFARLWEAIHGQNSWQENPWVWVLSFEVIHVNVDKILAGGE